MKPFVWGSQFQCQQNILNIINYSFWHVRLDAHVLRGGGVHIYFSFFNDLPRTTFFLEGLLYFNFSYLSDIVWAFNSGRNIWYILFTLNSLKVHLIYGIIIIIFHLCNNWVLLFFDNLKTFYNIRFCLPYVFIVTYSRI